MAVTDFTRTAFRFAVAGELLALLAFAFAARRADQAMNKSGLGDYAKFAEWTRWAGVAFWAAVGIWLVGMWIGWRLDRAGARAPLGHSFTLLFGLGTPTMFVVTYVTILALA